MYFYISLNACLYYYSYIYCKGICTHVCVRVNISKVSLALLLLLSLSLSVSLALSLSHSLSLSRSLPLSLSVSRSSRHPLWSRKTAWFPLLLLTRHHLFPSATITVCVQLRVRLPCHMSLRKFPLASPATTWLLMGHHATYITRYIEMYWYMQLVKNVQYTVHVIGCGFRYCLQCLGLIHTSPFWNNSTRIQNIAFLCYMHDVNLITHLSIYLVKHF